MAAWTLPGLGVKFGPSSFFFFFFLFLKACIFFFFFVIDSICFVFFFFLVGRINKFCVSVMAVFKFLLCLCLIFFYKFIQVEIGKNLLLLSETTKILFI